MRVLRHGDAVHGVPNGLRVAIDEVPGVFAAGTFLAAGIDHLDGDVFYLLEGGGCLHLLSAFVPRLDLSALLQVEGPAVLLRFAAGDTVEYGGRFAAAVGIARNADLAGPVAEDGYGAELVPANRYGSAQPGALREGNYQELHAVQRSEDAVGLQRSALAATVAAHAVHGAVQMEIGAVAGRKLVRMLCLRHLQGAPGQCRG